MSLLPKYSKPKQILSGNNQRLPNEKASSQWTIMWLRLDYTWNCKAGLLFGQKRIRKSNHFPSSHSAFLNSSACKGEKERKFRAQDTFMSQEIKSDVISGFFFRFSFMPLFFLLLTQTLVKRLSRKKKCSCPFPVLQNQREASGRNTPSLTFNTYGNNVHPDMWQGKFKYTMHCQVALPACELWHHVSLHSRKHTETQVWMALL